MLKTFIAICAAIVALGSIEQSYQAGFIGEVFAGPASQMVCGE